MAFVDEARINVTAGAGGDGSVSFLRQPYSPKGGPDGGDGGRGGDVILKADHSVGTLLELRDHPHIKAERGGHGSGKKRDGARGKDRVVLVPPGTVVFDDGGTLLADIASASDEVVIARGGRGGRGNSNFASASRRAPSFAEKGEPGEQLRLRLELRLLADVGLVGFPNAGKSTLIARISAARPKIADYPFTTLEPNLGVVRLGEESFVVADIPGLVPGAHEGKGLGLRFLRHVSRAALLVYMVDLTATDRDPVDDVETLRTELEAFDPELAKREALIVASKIDAARDRVDEARMRYPDVIPISAVTGEGIDELLRALATRVSETRAARPPAVGYVRHIVRDEPITVEREDSAWRVRGRAAESAVAQSDLDNDESSSRLQPPRTTLAPHPAPHAAGAKRGDEVRIGAASFDYEPEGDDGEA